MTLGRVESFLGCVLVAGAIGCGSSEDDGGKATGGNAGASGSGGTSGSGGSAGNGGSAGSGGTAGSAAGGSGGSGGGAPSGANLWIDGDGGSCTRSTSPAGYADSAACDSIESALSACQAGDTVVIKAGAYGNQGVNASAPSPGCTVVGEDGVTLGALNTKGDNLTLRQVTVDVGDGHAPGGWRNSGNNVTLESVALHGAFVSVNLAGSDVTWRGGELGVAGKTGGKRSCNSGDAEPVQIQNADHVLIDGVAFHPQDFDPTPCSGSVNGFHLEMIRIDSGTSFFTLQNSTFDDGDHSNTASIFITNVSSDPGDPTNLTFQNNFFGSADNATFSVHAAVDDCSSYVFAYNTFRNSPGDPTANGCSKSDGMLWVGNLGPRPGFFACAGTHTGNVWQNDTAYTCGTDTIVTGKQWGYDALGLGGPDGFHLQSGSPAIDKAESGGYCTSKLGGRDHDGDPRPSGAACDAGADEI